MIASPLRPPARQEQGVAAAGRLAHPRNALRRFTFVRDHNASMASFRPALTEAPQRKQPHWSRPVISGPRPCLFDVRFPLSGLQDRTHTSDLNVRARHTSSALRAFASGSTAAPQQTGPHVGNMPRKPSPGKPENLPRGHSPKRFTDGIKRSPGPAVRRGCSCRSARASYSRSSDPTCAQSRSSTSISRG